MVHSIIRCSLLRCCQVLPTDVCSLRGMECASMGLAADIARPCITPVWETQNDRVLETAGLRLALLQLVRQEKLVSEHLQAAACEARNMCNRQNKMRNVTFWGRRRPKPASHLQNSSRPIYQDGTFRGGKRCGNLCTAHLVEPALQEAIVRAWTFSVT